MGATDVIPFVPTMGMTVQECVELSKQVAGRIWDELRIPSFLYEDSATSPDRVNLAKIRKGQFEGMPEKLQQPEWAPDFGERKVHPTAGIIAIGARMPLIAYNINLDTSDIEVAKKIAKAIRAKAALANAICEKHYICTVGNSEKIKAAKELFKDIIDG